VAGLRVLVLSTVTAVAVQLGAVAVPANAAPRAAGLPAGATSRPPEQRTGSAAGLPHTAPQSATDRSPASAAPPRAGSGTARSAGAERAAPRPAQVPGRLVQAKPTARGVDPHTSVELAGRRTATSSTFANADGTETVRLYDGQANVRQPDGSYLPLDLRLNRQPSGRLVPRSGPVAVSFGPTAADPALADLTFPGGGATFAVTGAAPAIAVPAADAVTYRAVRPDADLRLVATATGDKEEILLRSRSAPASWTFSLRLRGLTPSLDASGSVLLTDPAGKVRATIPTPWMRDSAIDPRSGEGRLSYGVHYRLAPAAAGAWTLRVDLDQAWLHAADRVFPVVVDPSLQVNADADDTFVMSPATANNSANQELKIGTPDGGSTVAASYLHTNGLIGTLHNKYVLAAALNLTENWSASCTPSTVNVYAVTGAWAGSTMTTYPGAAFNPTPIASKSFAHGFSSSCPLAREGFAIDPDLATRWTHGLTAYQGLTVRASSTDSNGWKRFSSANGPIADNVPYLDVTYADQGAAYSIPAQTITPPVTANSNGGIKVDVQNLGQSSWPAGGPLRLSYRIFSGSTQVSVGAIPAGPPTTVDPGETARFSVTLPALDPGTYTVNFDMLDATNHSFHDSYGVPFGAFTLGVGNVEPALTDQQPPSGALVQSLRPTLYLDGTDPDGWPGTGLRYSFRICDGTPAAPTNCLDSGWSTSHTWTPPAGRLVWSHDYFWYGWADDNNLTGPSVGPLSLTTVVPQPTVTGHLASNLDGDEAAGVDAQVGNYAAQTTDASVATVGPELSIQRTYNSLDSRRSTAFGAGWASRVDLRLVRDEDDSGNVVVTLPTGQQVRFGLNTDGSYAPPEGRQLALVFDPAEQTYTMRDQTGSRYTFDSLGRPRAVLDAAGRRQSFNYVGFGPLESIVDDTSGRGLYLTWSAGHVHSVATDPPATGEPAPTWTYSYDGDRLTSVCGPVSATACAHYLYTTTSHYSSAVLDDNPKHYWHLDEASGSAAASALARSSGDGAGSYTNVTLGQPGALAGSDGTAASFAGDGYVTMPDKIASPATSLALELWFRTTASGVLASYQTKAYPAIPSTGFVPILYVDTSGFLRGGFWAPAATTRDVISAGTVNDGNWHHVVLTAAVNKQSMYLDGNPQGSITAVIDHENLTKFTIGAGYTHNWPATNDGNFGFTGQIDEVAYYTHPLGQPAVQAHYAARLAADSISRIGQPQDDRGFVNVAYDSSDGRLSTLVDPDGAAWTLNNPTLAGSTRTVTLRSSALPNMTYSYGYDIDHAGRITERTVTGITGGVRHRAFGYAANGFLSSITDENNHTLTLVTDARGNITRRTTCRSGTTCQTSYYAYRPPSGPLDPVADRLISAWDARTAAPAAPPAVPTDTTFQTTWEYDDFGDPIRTTWPKPNGVAARPTENSPYTSGLQLAVGGGVMPKGLPLRVTSPNLKTTEYAYNRRGDLVQATSPTGLVTTYAYDALGRVTSATAKSGSTTLSTTTYTWTPLSQLDTVTTDAVPNPITGVSHRNATTTHYDLDGNVTDVDVADLTGGDATRHTHYRYDAHDRLVRTDQPDGGHVDQSWSATGDLASSTDANGVVASYRYNERHLRTSTTVTAPGADPQDPAATSLVTESRSYDPAGRLATLTDAMGRTTRYTYFDDDLLQTAVRNGLTTPTGPRDVTLLTRAYDAAGNVTSEATPFGIGAQTTTSVVNDPAGLPKTVTLDPAGLARVTTYTRDADGNVATAARTGAASPGRTETTDYGYSAEDVLTSVSVHGDSGALFTTSLAQDARGLTVGEIEPKGARTDASYDATGALATVTAPAADSWVAGVRTAGVRGTTTIGRNTFGEITGVRDANGGVSGSQYDAMGRVTARTAPSYSPPGGGPAIVPTGRTSYDHAGNVLTTTDGLGRVTTYTYDPYGRVLTCTEPAVGTNPAGVWRYSYDRDGEQLSVTDPTGAQTLATYDELGRPITSTEVERVPGPVANYTTTISYDDAGNPVTVTTPLGHASTQTFNRAGEVTDSTDPTARETSIGRDLAGRAVSTTDPGGLVTSVGYDLAGRPVSATQQQGTAAALRTVRAEYDANGNTTATVSAENRRTDVGYDALDRPITITEHPTTTQAIAVGLGYDGAGNQTRTVDGNGHATDVTYNSLGLPESTVEPATTAYPAAADRTWTASYDANGHQVRLAKPGSVTVTRDYDELGRLSAEHGTGAEAATTDRSLGYDAAGRLVSVGSPGAALSYTWTDRNLLQSATSPAGPVSSTYDADNRLTGRTDPAGTSTYTYDDADRLESASIVSTGNPNARVNYDYDAAGLLRRMTHNTGGAGGPAARLLTRDDLHRVTEDRTDSGIGGRYVLKLNYAYDKDDNLLTKDVVSDFGITGAGHNSYTYDGASRLDTWSAPAGVTDYSWDAAGNRTGAGPTTLHYDERNRLTGDGTTSYSYSARGTLASATTSAASTALSFDAFDRLIGDGATAYSYDSLDRVAARGSTGFSYPDQANDPVAVGTYRIGRLPDGTPATDRDGPTGTIRFLVSDRHGDVVAATSAQTTVYGSTSFDPFGTPVSQAGTPAQVGYQGGWTDPDTDRVNMAARWYTPGTGTFASRDDAAVAPLPTAAGNRYTYGAANPLAYTDPTGHFPSVCDVPMVCSAAEKAAEVAGKGVRVLKPVLKIGGSEYTGLALYLYYLFRPTTLGYESCENRGSGACEARNYCRFYTCYIDYTDYPYYTNWPAGPSGGRTGSGVHHGSSGHGGTPGVRRYVPPPPPRWWVNLHTRVPRSTKPLPSARPTSVSAVRPGTRVSNDTSKITLKATHVSVCTPATCSSPTSTFGQSSQSIDPSAADITDELNPAAQPEAGGSSLKPPTPPRTTFADPADGDPMDGELTGNGSSGDEESGIATSATGSARALDIGGGQFPDTAVRSIVRTPKEAVSVNPNIAHGPSVVARSQQLPFANASFDRVALNHFPSDQFGGGTLSEVARVTRPGGTLSITTGPRADVSSLVAQLNRLGYRTSVGQAEGGIPWITGVLGP